MSYDRAAALDYARTYWSTVASDGYIAGSFDGKAYRPVPAGTRFVHDDAPASPEHALLPDGTVIPWSALDDCTHFLSCVVGRPPGATSSGGLLIPPDFPSGPYGILGAGRFVRTLVERGDLEVIPVEDKRDPGLARIAAGDLIGFYRASQRDYGHLALYAGDENIVCHTYCRADVEDCTWDHRYSLGLDDDDWQWRLLRVIAAG
jgi:hypothetical protein